MTRADAKELGLKRYFTGKPCQRGHVAERHVSNHACSECLKDIQRARYAATAEAADIPSKGTRHRFTARLEDADTVGLYRCGEIDTVTLAGVVHVETGRLVCRRLFFRVGFLNGPGWEFQEAWPRRGQFAAFTAEFRGVRKSGALRLFRPVLSQWHQSEETLPRQGERVAIDPKSGFPEADLSDLLPGRSLDDTLASWGPRALAVLCQKWKVSRPVAERIVKDGLAERDWSRTPPVG